MASFNDWLVNTMGLEPVDDGTSQNYFSKYYTLWLSSEVVGNEDIASWIASQLAGDQLLAFTGGEFQIVMNQNSTDGAPYLDFGAELGSFSLGDLFTGEKDSFSWTQGKAEQTRYYFDTVEIPGGVENQPPTNLKLIIDPAFAEAVKGDSPQNSTGQGAILGVLVAIDPDLGDFHTFEIVADSSDPARFEIVNDNQLKLVDGFAIDNDSGEFDVTIKVTDSAGNTYYETLNFIAGEDPFQAGPNNPNRVDELEGTDIAGDGSEADPVVGDDVILGFRAGDTLEGGSGDDALFGGQGNDTLIGGDGDDQLFGGNGSDILVGGPGDDILYGGEGDDTFIWNAGDEGSTASPAIDWVMDFGNGEDVIDIADLLGDDGNYVFGERDGHGTLEISTNGSDLDQVIVFNGISQAELMTQLTEGDNLIT